MNELPAPLMTNAELRNEWERTNVPEMGNAKIPSTWRPRVARFVDRIFALITFDFNSEGETGEGGRKNLPTMSQRRFDVGRFFRLNRSASPNARSYGPRSIKIGKVANALFQSEFLSEPELAHHVHVVGASGFGKTVFLSKIVKAQIEVGKGLLFIDLKGDIDLIERFEGFVERANRKANFQILNLSDLGRSNSYNILGNGSATEIRDRIIMSLDWTEEFYKHQAASYLLKILIGLCYARDSKGENFHVGDVFRLTKEIASIRELVAKIPEKETSVRPHVLDAQKFAGDQTNFATLQGLRAQLESIVLSDFGSLVTTNQNPIDLFSGIREGKCIFIFLDTRRFGPTARTIGKFILQDLKSVSSRIDAEVRKSDRKPFSVIIDEFADLAQEDFIAFLDRARSSKMSIVVSHQEISDLKRVSPEFAARVIANTASTYAFLQKNSDSAEFVSNLAGTRTVLKKTLQTERFFGLEIRTGNGSLREVEEFVIHPNIVKRLRVGECAVVKKYPYSRAHVVRVSHD